jgi:hypothetical protein
MSVPYYSVKIDRCYVRASEVRRVIALSGTSVLYVACDVAGPTEPSEPIQVPRDIFAREVDSEVPDPSQL